MMGSIRGNFGSMGYRLQVGADYRGSVMQGGIQLRVGDLLYAMRKRARAVIAIMLAALVVGAAACAVMQLRNSDNGYEITASAVFLAQSSAEDGGGNSPSLVYNDYRMSSEMADIISYILTSDTLLNKVVESTGLPVDEADLASRLQVEQEGDTPIMHLTLVWRDADEGEAILSSLLDNSTDVLLSTLGTGRMSVIDQPVAEEAENGRGIVLIMLASLIIGLCAGVVYAGIWFASSPRILTERDIPERLGCDSLGVLARDDNLFSNPKRVLANSRRSADSRRFLASANLVMERMDKADARCLLVTSAARGEGRTSIACMLAAGMAEFGKHVLLCDFDTGNPDIARYLPSGLAPKRNLNALMEGKVSPDGAITRVNANLDVLAALPWQDDAPSSTGIFDAIAPLVVRYDYVVFDVPPLDEASSTLALVDRVTASLMVIGFDAVAAYDIERGIDTLESSGSHVLGCVLNGEDPALHGKR